ncbi:MAG: hypothetical protein FJ255_03600 [Phycisphaerae bacterium]|nr:hypothetical protein [Phycisphaerae bacterium]
MHCATLQFERTLNSAAEGLKMALRALEALRADEFVTIDATTAERVTPSFANAFVMTILAEAPDAFKSHRIRLDAGDFVRRAFDASIDRYERGIRLSTQRAAPR